MLGVRFVYKLDKRKEKDVYFSRNCFQYLKGVSKSDLNAKIINSHYPYKILFSKELNITRK